MKKPVLDRYVCVRRIRLSRLFGNLSVLSAGLIYVGKYGFYLGMSLFSAVGTDFFVYKDRLPKGGAYDTDQKGEHHL